jgi:CHAT domain-containing protein
VRDDICRPIRQYFPNVLSTDTLLLTRAQRDLYAELRSGPDLVVLNGCSSGVLSEWGGKNPEGLSTGFLHGGAAQVVSTLWPVEDLTSALLLDRFHAELTALHRPTVAQALRRASNWLRGTGAARDALTNPEAVLCALENLCKRATEQGTTLDTPVMDHIKHCAAKIAALEPATPPFSGPGHWAAHMIHGAGWRPSAA